MCAETAENEMGHNGERQLRLDVSLVPILKPNF